MHSRYRRSPGARRPSGQTIELALAGGAYGGRMVARQEGRVVFVQGGLPGEEVRAELTTEKKSFAEARAARIVAASQDRTVPPCIYFGENGYNRGAVPAGNELPGERGACGGCQYQHLDYDAQLALKREIVADLIRRQAHLPDVEIAPTTPSPSPWRYRNRARWIVDDEGRPCYHQAASDRLLPVSLCHIVQPLIDETLRHLSDEAWRLPLRTMVAEITARTAVPWRDDGDTGEAPAPVLLLALHPRQGARRRDLRLFAADFGAAYPALNGIVMATATEAGSVQTGSALWGVGHFDAQFAGYRFRLSPLTFFQVNEPAAELMVQQVLDALGAVDGKSVLDVYAGAGTFTLPLASRAKQVLAIENDPMAIDDANHSARANGLDNVHMLPGDAVDELNGLPRHAAEAAVLDPPRAGLAEGVITELARIDVARIIYVSCDPATLARDLRRFAERGYTVASVQPVDLFPQTFHIESIAVLERV
jgi:23S rRNA (uracil1939-C5)-methyltransferase